MSGFAEYDTYDGLGLAGLVDKKEVTPWELCEEAISRIDRVNPKLNAVVTRMDEEGRKTASGPIPQGPFSGVPFLLKDLLAAYAGFPLTGGSKGFADYIPDHDSEMVVRFKRAGLVILGKTNTPEFGLKGITEPELFGPCRNPWNTGVTPGGSSGGSAAAVASGVVPLASAGDGGGSIRIPAACCGLFGLKPSRGRNPWGPDHGRIWQGAVQEHVITRSVRDSAAMLDATHGPDTGAPYIIQGPERPYLEEVGADPGMLKIAFTTTSPIGTTVHPECIKAVEEACRLLEELGHQVEERQPDVDGRKLAQSYLAMYFGEIGADLAEMKTILGRSARRSDVESLTWLIGQLGRGVSASDFVLSMRQWDVAARQMGRFFKSCDLYLTPATAYPPPEIGELDPTALESALINAVNTLNVGRFLHNPAMVDQMALKSLEKMPFTQLANLCGLPAMSVPLYWTPDQLPIGIQLVAPFGDEATLFRLAGQLETARPWFNRRPPVFAAG